MGEGYGNLFWKDGSHYSGQFSNNTKNGEGTLFYSNGDVFSGHWVEERMEGDGEYHYMPGGSLKNYVGTYEGGFKGGLPEGQGKFTAAKGGKVFEGEYKGGKRKSGEYTDISSSSTYTGDFETSLGTYGGQGKYVWACERCTLAASRLGCLMVRRLWSIQVAGDMSENLWRGRCMGRGRSRGRTEPLTRGCSTTGR